MNEPLKNKVGSVDDFQIRSRNDCHKATETRVFEYDDIKSAVEWLKAKLIQAQKETSNKESLAYAYCFLKVDEAFEDVMKK